MVNPFDCGAKLPAFSVSGSGDGGSISLCLGGQIEGLLAHAEVATPN